MDIYSACIQIKEAGKNSCRTWFVKLPTDSKQAFLKSVKADRPVVYVIPESQMHYLPDWDDIIQTIENKDAKIELYRCFIKKQKIPMVPGSYTAFGKIETSIRTFLARLERTSPQINPYNAFILGLNDEFLFRIFENHESVYLEQFKSDVLTGVKPAEPAPAKKISRQMPIREKASPDTLANVVIGDSSQMNQVRTQILLAGRHSENILLLGETGTGKSLAARTIHSHSNRKNYPFVTFNCGAVTGTLFESELFGHIKGAFTGAHSDRKGLWREAENGTLFFDEIGELPLEQQTKILVALDRRIVRPVGSDKTFKVNARLIFATNQDLYAMVQKGTFREDLYWRIRYITMEMPQLREQKEAIPVLAARLWTKISQDSDHPLSDEILATLAKISWPGNIRSLKAVLKSLYYYNIAKQPKEMADLYEVLGFMQLGPAQKTTQQVTSQTSDEVDMHRVYCLRHLKKASEWIRACQKLFTPYLETGNDHQRIEKIDPNLVRNRHEQIRSLTEEPLMFYKEDSFMLMNTIQGKFTYFYDLIEKKIWDQAFDYLKKELQPNIDKARTLLFQSVESLLK